MQAKILQENLYITHHLLKVPIQCHRILSMVIMLVPNPFAIVTHFTAHCHNKSKCIIDLKLLIDILLVPFNTITCQRPTQSYPRSDR